MSTDARPETALAIDSFSYCGRAPLRVYGSPDEPLFIAQDVCEALGITFHRDALQKLPDYAVGRRLRVDAETGGKGSVQDKATLTEGGLNYLIMRSDKPDAEAFQKWVCCEVLPTIRRNGLYALTGGASTAERRYREMHLELERQRYLMLAEQSLRKLTVLRGGLPPPAPKAAMTITEWCAAHRPNTDRQQLIVLASRVKRYAKANSAEEFRKVPTGNPRYSQPAWMPDVIAAALDFTATKPRTGGPQG